MPRYQYLNPRSTTSDLRSISLSVLLKKGYLKKDTVSTVQVTWSHNGNKTGAIEMVISTLDTEYKSPYIELNYKVQSSSYGTWKKINYEIEMLGLLCRFGGKKWFFICGFNGCQNIVRSIYKDDLYFICRHCARLSYESCNQSKKYRGGYFKLLSDYLNLEDYPFSFKRKFYKGKPTKNYTKYLKMNYLSESQVGMAQRLLDRLLTGRNK